MDVLNRISGTVVLFLAVLSPALMYGAAAPGPSPILDVNPTPQPVSIVSPTELLLSLGMQIHRTHLDCSHLVNYLYDVAGYRYTYAESRRLYSGVSGFRRTSRPEPGDLIVWRGHVGIVVDPQEHSFLSALRTGVKVARYDSRYWRGRGRPRFLRYSGL